MKAVQAHTLSAARSLFPQDSQPSPAFNAEAVTVVAASRAAVAATARAGLRPVERKLNMESLAGLYSLPPALQVCVGHGL